MTAGTRLSLLGLAALIALLPLSSRASNPSSAASAAKPAERASLADWPSEQTSEPKPSDWDSATQVSLTRAVGGRATACVASRVHEWLRVRCPELRVSAITQLGGDVEGTRFGINLAGQDGVAVGGEVVLPLRPKQRRVIMLWGLGPGYDGPLTVAARLVLQTDWSGAVPLVLLHDAVHEPVRTAQSERRAQQPAEPSPNDTSTW